MESLEMGDEEDELRFNETTISSTTDSNSHQASGNTGSDGTVLSAVLQKKHSSQTIPLLEQSDSDDSNNDNEQSASDVIFDVLKRRDMQR